MKAVIINFAGTAVRTCGRMGTMGRLIDADELEYMQIGTNAYVRAEDIFSATPVDAVPVVRCKNCKHRPIGINRDDLEFPDDKCPCKCEDYWYSWKPSDDWFCGNGEWKDDDSND